jgi:DNA-binding CsgD family transcriptional regulator/tetratricopeptide (TPR) repeat protein
MSTAAVVSLGGEDRASAEPPPRRLTAPALIGRARELETLLGTALSPPSVVMVDGEAGVGKTRLVRELLARPELRGRAALVGYGQPLRDPFPFGPVLDALRGVAGTGFVREPGAVAGALRPLLPELDAVLPPAVEPLADARADRHRTFRAVAELLRALGPAVCVLEDLHWADEGTGELLRFLVSALPPELCLVLTYRGEDLRASGGRLELPSRLPVEVMRSQVRLEPLDPADVRRLVTSILGIADVSPDFASYLHERTLGLPFAVEEILQLLAGRRDLARRRGRAARRMLEELEVPAAVQDFTLERQARLSPDARRITQAAAVVGTPADARLLRRVAGLSAARAERAFSEALALGLLRETTDGHVVPRHVLAQRVVYEAIQPFERRRLHLRAARGLEAEAADRPLAQIAHHFHHAGVPRKWIAYAESAADLASALGNHPAACDLLVEVLDSDAVSAAARARLAVKLGRTALGSLDYHRAEALLRRVLEEEGVPVGVRGELRLYLGLLLDNQAGQASVGLAEIARAVPELRRRPGLAARAMSALAIPMSTTGHVSEHVAWLDRALEAAERALDPALRTAVLVNRATVLMHIGDPQAGRAVADLAQPAAAPEERRQLLRANGNLAHASTCIGHYGRADTFLGRALAALAEASDPYLGLSLEATSVLLDWNQGRWAGLEERALALVQESDLPLVCAEAELVLGLLRLAHGEILAAKAHLESARDVGWTGGSVPVVVAAAGGLARLLLARGDARRTAAHALPAVELVRHKGVWLWAAEVAPAAVEALLALERRAEAGALADELAKGLRGRDAPAAHAALTVCRALVAAADGRGEHAARGFARAERSWEALPRPYEAARCREARALLLPGPDTGLLADALAGFNALGAAWDAARVRRLLREQGVLRPWRGGRKGYGSRLSPREQEVVRLAAQGRTNREIAEALVISPRTVESHLAKGMRKIGVRTRTALAVAEPE